MQGKARMKMEERKTEKKLFGRTKWANKTDGDSERRRRPIARKLGTRKIYDETILFDGVLCTNRYEQRNGSVY